MQRIMFTYGGVSGLIIILSFIWAIVFAKDGEASQISAAFGYLIMLVALSAIFLGIKKFRDQHQGGVITFAKAALLGLGISLVASVIYVVAWEIYMAMSDNSFIHNYTDGIIQAKQAAGVSAEELEKVTAEMDKLVTQYANPLFRVPMTFLEIFPMGLLVTVISALLLRMSKFLPAKA